MQDGGFRFPRAHPAAADVFAALPFDAVKLVDDGGSNLIAPTAAFAPPQPSGVFSAAQAACICRSLHLNREGTKLVDFFDSHPRFRQLCETVNRESGEDVSFLYCSHLFALFARGHFDELRVRLEKAHVNSAYHKDLQSLWNEVLYADDERRKNKKLGPVDKYRLRQKRPPPRSIWNGEKCKYSFTESQRAALVRCYRENQYPKPEDKAEIARCTGLKPQQISNWFKNRRQRDKSTPTTPAGLFAGHSFC